MTDTRPLLVVGALVHLDMDTHRPRRTYLVDTVIEGECAWVECTETGRSFCIADRAGHTTIGEVQEGLW